MNIKIIGLLVCTLFITSLALPVFGTTVRNKTVVGENLRIINEKNMNSIPILRDGWGLQWSKEYGGNGHSQLAQPSGDIDQDGVNEVIVGGYENFGICRILSYDPYEMTYIEEYSWYVPGGSYHSPSGACIADINNDGDLELCVSWAYSGADGVYAYKWDGTTLTTLDWYYGVGVDFVFDIYACDYNDDGNIEVLIANAPNMGTGDKHVSALGWDSVNENFVLETSWSCPGGASMECPEVWSGDVDNDGLTEVIADVSNGQSATAGTWALNWNTDTQSWDGVPVWTNYGSATVYGDGVADIDGDGTPEIGIGCYGGTPQGWMFEWDGSAYQEVWNGQYPGGQPTIESVALGDADNDGHNEFCFGTGYIHVIAWDGENYYEEKTLTDPTGMLAGLNIGDYDTDGVNEMKACEILSGTGSEFIYKYYDGTPPVTTCELNGEMKDDVFISDVIVYLNATDEHSMIKNTMYKLDEGNWQIYENQFIVSEDGTHTIKFYSVDNYGNQEEEKSNTFTIKHPSCFYVEIPKGLGFGLKANVKEMCNEDHTKVSWKFKISGGTVIPISPLSGTFDISSGGTKIIKSSLVLGIGAIKITINVDDCDPVTVNGIIIGALIYIY